jgi:hypothetical protein
MSENKLDTDALATEEMLKMFENMESQDLAEAADVLSDDLSDDLLDVSLVPVDTTAESGGFELSELDMDLPDVSQTDSMDAEIIEMPDDDLSLRDIVHESETLEMPEIMLEATPDLEPLPEVMAEAMPTLMTNTTESSNPITNHLNAVVENAVQALQDWLLLRQRSEESGPQQGLAQLDVLLDTVTQQQQHLAEQLSQAPKVDYAGMATALGVTLASPQALGWTADQWRVKAESVAHKTDDIAAMNAKLRKQLEQF